MKKIAASIAMALMVVGCAGSKFSFADARRVRAGMTTAEVQAIMGKPYMVSSREGKEIWIWSHANGLTGSHQSISFVFTQGVLESVPKIPDSFD